LVVASASAVGVARPVILLLPIAMAPDIVKPVKVPVLVIFGCAAVVTVPAVVARGTVPVTLAPVNEVKLAPDPTNKLADITFAPVIFPPVPDVTILAAVKLPVAFNVPATLTPVPVTTIIFALPAALILTLPFALGILTLLLPLTMEVALPTPVSRYPLPEKKLAVTRLPKLALPDVILPVTVNAVKVPVLVMFGCAAVVTVPAVVASGTVPVTLAPVNEVKLAPDPTNKLADITFPPVIFPPVPDVTILAAVKLPVAFNVPATLTPVPVTTIIFALPAALILTFPFALGMVTLLLPLTKAVALPTPVSRYPLPEKKLAVTRLPKLALPDVILPVTAKLVKVPVLVIFGCAAVVTVPAVVASGTVPVTLAPVNEVKLAPDPTNKLAETTFAPVIFPPVPDVTILAAVKLPVAFNVPATLTPVPVTTIIFALPTALILTFPFALGILTLLLPLTMAVALPTPVSRYPLPVKKLAVTKLPRLALPALILPVTVNAVKVPVLVMFGCAAVVTVPAVVARGTVPVTLAPVNEVKLAPDPTNKLAETTFAPVRFPPVPEVTILPTVKLPVAFNVPATLTPVPVTTIMFALPATDVVTLPPEVAIDTLLVPLAMLLVLAAAAQVNVPAPSVCST